MVDVASAAISRASDAWRITDNSRVEYTNDWAHEIFDAGLARWSRRKINSLRDWSDIDESPME